MAVELPWLSEDRLKEISDEFKEHLAGLDTAEHLSDGAGAVSSLYTSLSFAEVVSMTVDLAARRYGTVDIAVELVEPDQTALRHCSFCGKSSTYAKYLMAGPRADICDECIALGAETMKQREASAESEEASTRNDDEILF